MSITAKRGSSYTRRWMSLFENSANTINFEGITIIWLPLIFMLTSGMILIPSAFSNLSIETTSTTNIGFAILAGISSVCFSWAGRVDREVELEHHDELVELGQLSFHSALIFVISSGLKYVHLNLDSESPLQHWFGQNILRFFYGISFVIAFEKAILSITGLNKVLYFRLNSK